MNEYDIAIRETLEMTVTVEAASREEAPPDRSRPLGKR